MNFDICFRLWNRYHFQDTEHFYHPQKFSLVPLQFIPSSTTWYRVHFISILQVPISLLTHMHMNILKVLESWIVTEWQWPLLYHYIFLFISVPQCLDTFPNLKKS